MRNLRDNYMLASPEWKPLIKEYYDKTPSIVQALDSQSNSAEIYNYLYETLVRTSIELIEQGKNKQAVQYYSEYVAGLETMLK